MRGELRGLVEEVKAEEQKLLVKLASPDKLLEAARKLKEMGFVSLISITAIDDPQARRIRLIYHVEHAEDPRWVLWLTLDLPRDEPRAPSVASVWPPAYYHEKEVWEMMGVNFDEHPGGLRHLLLPPDWPSNVHPLRKDFKVPDEPFIIVAKPQQGGGATHSRAPQPPKT